METKDDIKLPPLPEWSMMDDLCGLVPSEIRQALTVYAHEAIEADRQRRSDPVTGGNVSELLSAIQLFGSRKREEGAGLSDSKLQAVRSAWDEVYQLVQVVAAPQPVEQSPEVQALKRDKERLDWLAVVDNRIGNVLLPRVCVERNPHSLRDAIDDAMESQNESNN